MREQREKSKGVRCMVKPPYTKTSSNHIYKQRTLKKSVHDVLMNYNECLFYKHKNSVKVCNVGACAG